MVMTNFQARIKPEYQKRFPQLKSWVGYDVDPLWPASKTRGPGLVGNRWTRRVTRGEHPALRAGDLHFRPHPKPAKETA